MVFEICAIVATIAFIVLVVYLILALVQLRRTLQRSSLLMNKVEEEMPSIKNRCMELLENSNDALATVHDQLRAFNPLMNSIETVGCAVEDFAQRHTHPARTRRLWERKKRLWDEKAANFLDWAALGANVWKNIQKRRKKNYE